MKRYVLIQDRSCWEEFHVSHHIIVEIWRRLVGVQRLIRSASQLMLMCHQLVLVQGLHMCGAARPHAVKPKHSNNRINGCNRCQRAAASVGADTTHLQPILLPATPYLTPTPIFQYNWTPQPPFRTGATNSVHLHKAMHALEVSICFTWRWSGSLAIAQATVRIIRRLCTRRAMLVQ